MEEQKKKRAGTKRRCICLDQSTDQVLVTLANGRISRFLVGLINREQGRLLAQAALLDERKQQQENTP